MAQQQHPNKQKYNQQYLNWFDNMKSVNSRYGVGWIDHVDGPKIADGIFKLIPEFEKGKISFDCYPEAFGSNHFITHATQALNGKARELSIITIALSTSLSKNYVTEKDKSLVTRRYQELVNEQNILNFISSSLNSFGVTKDKNVIYNMLNIVYINGQQKKCNEQQYLLEMMRTSNLINTSSFISSINEEIDKARTANRLVVQFTRPKFNMHDFVKELKKDITIIPYIMKKCIDEIYLINYMQAGLVHSTDPLSQTYYNEVQRKRNVYEIINSDFSAVKDMLDNAYLSFQYTKVYTFPISVEYTLVNMQNKLVDSYRNTI